MWQHFICVVLMVNGLWAKACDNPSPLKLALQEEYTQSIEDLITNGGGIKEYEASGVTYDTSRQVYWVVYDNSLSITKLTKDLSKDENNIFVAPSTDIKIHKNDEGYEGITHDTDTDIFYLLTESLEFDNGKKVFHPMIRSVTYDEATSFTQIEICAVDIVLETDNKGFEGLDLITIDGTKYFVGLCEGNFCASSSTGRDVGNGRIVLIEFTSTDISSDKRYQYLMNEQVNCVYNVINIFALPSDVRFEDYSGLQFMKHDSLTVDNLYNVAITSQSSSALWVGQVVWSLDGGPVFDEYETYPFPYDADCEVMFCNVEGVTFVNEFEFVMVSDKGKSKRCRQKAQSVHIFILGY